MKLCTFAGGPDGRAVPGVITPDCKGIISLADDFDSLIELIEAGEEGLSRAKARLAEGGNVIWLKGTKLLAPIPLPPQFRDFNNHPQHMRDATKGGAKLRAKMAGQSIANIETMEFPVLEVYRQLSIFYITNRFSIAGHEADVQRPAYCHELDYELELAMVIGKGGKNIKRKDAPDHIFGYTIFNDFSARDRQMHEMEGHLGPAKGKSFDGGNVLGPWIVTKDEIPDPFALKVKVRVNGEVCGQNDGREMIHDFPKMIEYVSENETLHAGEIFGSGTFGGCCGLELDTFLKDGDVVELEIEKIGVLRNKIVAGKLS